MIQNEHSHKHNGDDVGIIMTSECITSNKQIENNFGKEVED